MATIYLSSTYSDLREHRETVYRALRQMRHDVIAMEDYMATDNRPLDKCLVDVANCDLYIGIFAWRYGYIPSKSNPEHKSITELEYREATQLGKPCLIFILDKDAPWPPHMIDAITGEGNSGKKITELRRDLAREKLVSFFSTSEHLASLVSAAAHIWEKNYNIPVISDSFIYISPQNIEFSIQQGEITTFASDVIALKYSQGSHENDELITCLKRQIMQRGKLSPAVGEYSFVENQDCVHSHGILFVGVAPITSFNYLHIQEFSAQVLFALAKHAPNTKHLAMTIHGVEAGLDEIEALLAQFNGYIDAIQREQLPSHLRYISIIDDDLDRVKRLRQAFEQTIESADYASKLSGKWAFHIDTRKLNQIFRQYQNSIDV